MTVVALLRSVVAGLRRHRRPGPDWSRVQEVFAAALAVPGEQRRAHVDHACRGDAALRAEVLALLAANDAVGVIDRPLDSLVSTFFPPTRRRRRR